MKINSTKLKKIVCILLDIKEDEIFNIYTINDNEYLISLIQPNEVLKLKIDKGNIFSMFKEVL